MKIEKIGSIADVVSSPKAHDAEILGIYNQLKPGQYAEISAIGVSRHGIQQAIGHLTEQGLIKNTKLRTLLREGKTRLYLFRYD